MTYKRHFSPAFLEGSFKTTRVAHLSLFYLQKVTPLLICWKGWKTSVET